MSLLPAAVRSRLQILGEGVKRAELATRATRISDAYRQKQNSNVSLLDRQDALAYAMTRMPATYAATAKAMMALVDSTGVLIPITLLDVGCGPGSATIAALEAFPSLENITLMDRNAPLLALAEDLVGAVAGARHLTRLTADIARNPTFPIADVVLASYVMVELPDGAATALARRLWAVSQQTMLLVEPGTPEGFRRLQEIRLALVSDGASVAAPCTHENACPMQAGNWCRFMARVQRSRDHRMLKQAALAHEDEPFAYLAFVRMPPQQRLSHRIINRSFANKIGISLSACGSAGLETLFAGKREAEKHRDYRKLDWGDAVMNQSQQSQPKDEE